MSATTKYLCPGSSEYWRDRCTAFALIGDIEVDIRGLALEEEGPYWDALQFARINPTVHEILRAQGRDAILTPPLGDIPEMPRSRTPIADEVAERFPESERPVNDPKALEDWECERSFYRDQLEYWEEKEDEGPFVQRIMTEDGIVRIAVDSSEDEESSSYSRESYLNGELHDIDGEPALQKRSHHRIPSEGYLDEDYEISYRHGEEVKYIDHDDRVVAGWCHAQRVAFGAAEFDDVA